MRLDPSDSWDTECFDEHEVPNTDYTDEIPHPAGGTEDISRT